MESIYRKLLDATIELMNEKGYHGTSIQMIADKVGVSKSTIFYHFKNKEGILLSILEDFVPPATNALMLVAKNNELTGTEKLIEFIRLHMRHVETSGDVLRLYLRESRFVGDKNRPVYKESQRTYAHLLIDIIRQIQRENKQSLKDLDPEVVGYSILGMCNSVVAWFNRDGKIGFDELASAIYRMLSENLVPQDPDPGQQDKTS
jgi:AcrR family transcriptional regulator